MLGKDLVEKRPGASFAQLFHDAISRHAEMVKDPGRHEGRAVESHAAMREYALPVFDQLGSQSGDCVEFVEIGQFLIKNREVNVEAAIRARRDAFVEPPFEVDDGIDSE